MKNYLLIMFAFAMLVSSCANRKLNNAYNGNAEVKISAINLSEEATFNDEMYIIILHENRKNIGIVASTYNIFTKKNSDYSQKVDVKKFVKGDNLYVVLIEEDDYIKVDKIAQTVIENFYLIKKRDSRTPNIEAMPKVFGRNDFLGLVSFNKKMFNSKKLNMETISGRRLFDNYEYEIYFQTK